MTLLNSPSVPVTELGKWNSTVKADTFAGIDENYRLRKFSILLTSVTQICTSTFAIELKWHSKSVSHQEGSWYLLLS
jgi:hypothetical protein